jgi:hypothetical protein
MTFSDVLDKLKERSRNRKELIRDLDERVRIEELVQERKKSANERELERFMKEHREENIKVQLDEVRKMRDKDIKFNHNPLNAKNIMKSEWEVMKEPNMFTGKGNMFANQPFIHKNNPKLLKNERWLFH